ncbi:RNA polymerase II elongation factor ELL-like isoform X2 [Dendronephthya gigantea]|uniref:RNA polymerase II elongation factor ELL-like isoform X2 n=1 Tax=Dendronephthya gigantea TaxID=151771 RepID=UPI0010695350|nr:RNA polymerase II elongation factor ELL-like isoform X2 [Dendronephthya gigantea]
MAVCLESSSSFKIVSKNDQKPNKSLFLVKLTDSCLKTLDQLQNPTLSKNGATRKPSIQFKNNGKSGMLFIPSKNGDNNGTKFNFSFSNLSAIDQECVQQNRGDGNLTLLGNITGKITIGANNDSYEATKHRVAEAKKERTGKGAKVIELSKDGAIKKQKRINPRQKINFRKTNINNKISQSSSSSLKGLREKVIHLLALRPCNKLELRMKLEKDGVKLKDAVSVLTNILQQVSAMQDNVYVLNRHLYSEIQVDTWPGYTDEDRETIKSKIVSEMGSSVDRLSPGPFSSSLLGNNSSKRPLSGMNKPGTNPAGKRPRIAHQNTSKSDIKRPPVETNSPPKLTSQPPRHIPSRRASREKTKTNPEAVKKPINSTKTQKAANGSENTGNDSNNNNCSFSKTQSPTNEDYLTKYPEIKTYEQRCSYKEDFAKEYDEFKVTKERLDLVTKQFNELKEQLKKHPEDSRAAKDLHDEIFQLYEEKKERWTKDRQRLNYLFPKLSHIKKLVIQYDQVHFGAS